MYCFVVFHPIIQILIFVVFFMFYVYLQRYNTLLLLSFLLVLLLFEPSHFVAEFCTYQPLQRRSTNNEFYNYSQRV